MFPRSWPRLLRGGFPVGHTPQLVQKLLAVVVCFKRHRLRIGDSLRLSLRRFLAQTLADALSSRPPTQYQSSPLQHHAWGCDVTTRELCCLTQACSARLMNPRLCRQLLKGASWSLLCRQTGYDRQASTQVRAVLLFCAFACSSACLWSTQLTAETFLASIWSGDFEGKYQASVGPEKSSSI